MTGFLGIPAVPLALGLGGLLPFAGLAAVAVAGGALGFGAGDALRAIVLYGAIIASFLGGIRWGAALRGEGRADAADYVLSIAPALAAWACLLLEPGRSALALAALVAAWGFVDQDLPRRGLAPPWFGRLRAILSAGAALSLAAAGLGT